MSDSEKKCKETRQNLQCKAINGLALLVFQYCVSSLITRVMREIALLSIGCLFPSLSLAHRSRSRIAWVAVVE